MSLGSLVFAGLLALSSAPAQAQQAVPASLDAAYQKEYAYLEAEKAALESRLSEVQAQSRSRVGSAEAELSGRESRLRSLVGATERTEEVLMELERSADNASERADRLETTLDQATASLDLTPIPDSLAEDPDAEPGAYAAAQGQLLRQSFSGVADKIAQASMVRIEEGTFFLTDGTQVEGEVLRVGQVAAYGKSGSTAGALLPAGNDRLKIRGEGDGGTADKLFAGTDPGTLGVFLYEDLRKEVVERKAKGVMETVEAGGLIAYVIVGLGIFGVFLSAMRFTFLMVAGRGQGVQKKVLAKVQQGDLEGAASLVVKGSNPTQRVLRGLMRELGGDREAL